MQNKQKEILNAYALEHHKNTSGWTDGTVILDPLNKVAIDNQREKYHSDHKRRMEESEYCRNNIKEFEVRESESNGKYFMTPVIYSVKTVQDICPGLNP